MKCTHLKRATKIAAVFIFFFGGLFCLVAASAQTKAAPGDGIFTPVISPVAAIDKTGRPITMEVAHPEPGLAAQMVTGRPTGDSYIISFPTSSAGGMCVYNGKGRYMIESTGNLTFQILADCGKLRRAYGYIVCRMSESLNCSDAPWWYFKGRTYVATERGIVINGSTMIPWDDPAAAPGQLQTMASKIKEMNDRFRGDPHALHTRMISCRNFHPETKSYNISEISTSCLIKSLCDGIPSVDSLRDGDVVDWNTPVGEYVKKQNKISDTSTWTCWIRTQ